MKDKLRLKSIYSSIEDIEYFIAHDYDSVDDEISEIVLRVHLPKIETKIKAILKEKD